MDRGPACQGLGRCRSCANFLVSPTRWPALGWMLRALPRTQIRCCTTDAADAAASQPMCRVNF